MTLTYDVRGPELAVVLPDGDLDALREVTELLSQMWNGPGTLLLTADESGALGAGLQDSLAALPPDVVLLHPGLPAGIHEALIQRWPGRTGQWQARAIERELHAWWLVRESATRRTVLRAPSPTQNHEAVLAAVLWGWIDPVDTDTIREQFVLVPAQDNNFRVALLRGQLQGSSPLAWAARLTNFTESVNGPTQRALYVFQDAAAFNELVLFWNIRARYPRWGDAPTVVGMTVEMFDDHRCAAAIREWMAQPSYGTKPDLRVSTSENDADAVRSALVNAGLTFVDTGDKWTSFSVVPEDRRRPEFALAGLSIPQRLRRGLHSESLVGLREGANPVHVPKPPGLPAGAGWRGLVHLELRGLPIAFPMSDPLAAACLDNGIAVGTDAVVAAFGGGIDPLRFDIRIPPADIQLERHLTSVMLRAEVSSAGRIASTLLGRLDGKPDLDALANPWAPRILDALVARSRKKLAQRVRQELEKTELASIDEQVVVDLLRREGLFAELATRTSEQLQGAVGGKLETLLPALGGLCDAGYLQRGRSLSCPRCRTRAYWRLNELDERLRCRACRQEFVLPAVEGTAEAKIAYRLDGLVARAMDQDIVAVLLTLRHILGRRETSTEAQWWLGLDLYENGSVDIDYEIDLLIADRGTLRLCEVKSTAEGMTADIARSTIALADRVGGEAVLAAPGGTWHDDVVSLFDVHEFLLLGPELLLDAEG